jgi:hypothetical protein
MLVAEDGSLARRRERAMLLEDERVSCWMEAHTAAAHSCRLTLGSVGLPSCIVQPKDEDYSLLNQGNPLDRQFVYFSPPYTRYILPAPRYPSIPCHIAKPFQIATCTTADGPDRYQGL